MGNNSKLISQKPELIFFGSNPGYPASDSPTDQDPSPTQT